MATKVIGKIILYEPLDQDKITDLLAGSDTIVFEVQRQYQLGDVPELLGAILPTQFDDVTIDYIESLKNIIDISTWQHQEDAIMYKCNYDSGTKTFDFSGSYVRDSKDTSGTLTAISTGQILNAVFTTPGLEGSIKTTIELPYGQAISASDSLLLRAVGIFIDDFTSTGDNLVIDVQNVPYKVQFIQPEKVSTVNYVIDFSLTNITIENVS